MAHSKEARETNETGRTERKPPQSAEASPPARAESRGLGVFEDIDRLFDEFMSSRWPALAWQPPFRALGGEAMRGRLPSIDICENDEEVVVRAEVPGVSRDQLDVSVVDRTLTIKGRTRDEIKDEREDYYRREIRSGEFSRSVLLPATVDSEKAKASMKDGVVELRLPKASGAKRRRIELS